MKNSRNPRIGIGELSRRSGASISAIRFYTDRGLLPCERSAGGSRRFARDSLRRLSFILIAQQLGYTLDAIGAVLDTLPTGRTPTRADWSRLARRMRADLDQRIDGLQAMRDKIDGCIGCGCLSLRSCALYNPDDQAAGRGTGARYLLGDSPPSP